MKIWEVELKEKEISAKNHVEAPIVDTMHVEADDYDLAARNAMKQSEFCDMIATSIRLIAETKGSE